MITKIQILNQLHSLRHTGFAPRLEQHALAHGFTTPFFFAIASRETNCINELGDFQKGEFHGVGIIQIDIQHPIAREARDSGSWKTNPDPLIDFGAQILQTNIAKAKQRFPSLSPEQQLKIAASGYNCGISRAIIGAEHGDSDKLTTGKNYGRDVMTRMATFEELISEGH
ncbi:MAG TPA: hypothetical protein DC047_06200 [Blastocatellia bacterium]|nr:hypothetical protein [Blastocatellia bacterium]